MTICWYIPSHLLRLTHVLTSLSTWSQLLTCLLLRLFCLLFHVLHLLLCHRIRTLTMIFPLYYVKNDSDDSTVTNFSKGLRFNGGCDGRRGGHGDRGRGGGLMVELRDRNNGESWNELEVLVVESEKAVVASSEKMAVMVVEKSWSHGGGERDCRQVFPAMLNVGIDKQRLIEERLCE
ncbi:hypothetical protein CsatB_007400 [Cannabis sativa]|uniref:uncharacterized protein LOC115713429 n=1 Tax=Cannabis sativa TaxID=3483 RepID=UPI0029CA8FE1|nr:uncharacterized protein LOC115713429 [Cannabis sativa]